MTLLFILKFKTNHMQLQSAFCPCGFPILRFKELGVENYFPSTVGSLQMQGDDSALSYVICIKHCALMDLGILESIPRGYWGTTGLHLPNLPNI